MRCFCRVEYDGTAYAGWQRQEKEICVQSAIESAFKIVVRRPCPVVGAGRTDAGVHARGQGIHVNLPEHIDLKRCEISMNAVLPKDIAIYNLQTVEDSFHARFSAIARRYKYYIVSRKMPLLYKRALFIPYALDWKRMEESLPLLLGRHDFSTFCAAGSNPGSKICTVRSAAIEHNKEMHIFTIEADRFLYKMVRSIVGTLIEIGKGANTEPLDTILQKKDRSSAGDTVAAHGLILEYVYYEGVA